MKFRILAIIAVASLTVSACGDSSGVGKNGEPNNTENNTANNTENNTTNNAENNTENNATNNAENNTTNNATNNTANNTTNNATNNTTNNATNNTTNNVTNNTTNNATNSTTNNATNNTTNNQTNGNAQTCDGDFGEADACGGDPTGTWDITEACSNYDYTALIQQACPNATVNDVVFEVSGELTVVANAAFTQSIEGTATADIKLPNGCTVGCQAAEQFLGVGAESATCMNDGAQGCDCEVVYDIGDDAAGTYTTADGVVTIDSGETYYYCVSGGTLQLREFGTQNDDAVPVFLYTER